MSRRKFVQALLLLLADYEEKMQNARKHLGKVEQKLKEAYQGKRVALLRGAKITQQKNIALQALHKKLISDRQAFAVKLKNIELQHLRIQFS